MQLLKTAGDAVKFTEAIPHHKAAIPEHFTILRLSSTGTAQSQCFPSDDNNIAPA